MQTLSFIQTDTLSVAAFFFLSDFGFFFNFVLFIL